VRTPLYVFIYIVYYYNNNNISFRILLLRFACVYKKCAFVSFTENKWPGRGGCVHGKEETRSECNVAFCPQSFAISLPSPLPPSAARCARAVYNIVLLLQSVLLFPSGDALKSLFYGKQHCLETRGDTKYSRFVLFASSSV